MIKLNVKTDQEAFDKVVNHLRKMIVRSTTKNLNCAYRGPNGARCGIGVLIDDDNLASALDNLETSDIHHLIGDLVIDPGTISVSLLVELQFLHDASDYWNYHGWCGERYAANLAHQFSLTYTGKALA